MCRELEWATAHFGARSRYKRMYRDTGQLGRAVERCDMASSEPRHC